MSVDSYTGIIGEDKNITVGAWLIDDKGKRSRCLGVIQQNQPGKDNDMSYLGYYHNQKDPKGTGCNLSIALAEDEVQIQCINPVTKITKTANIPVEKFFDFLDALCLMDLSTGINAIMNQK